MIRTLTKHRLLLLSSLIVVLALSFVGPLKSYSENNFEMAGQTKAIFTFTFRDGIEVIEFPVFQMNENMVDNSGVSFTVEGIIGNYPHLYEALDEAFKYRIMKLSGSSFEYNYRFFDVDVEFVQGDQHLFDIDYYNCEVQDYTIKTLNDDYESYLSSKTGFATVYKIEFNCSGLDVGPVDPLYAKNIQQADSPVAANRRTLVTFDFAEGSQQIEFPYFELTSGFQEEEDNVAAKFKVEGLVSYYPLLWDAINNARKVSGGSFSSNPDFDSTVEFLDGNQLLRALNFQDCRVSDAKITTQYDKEEGFTGKSGFALVAQLEFSCAGLLPQDNSADVSDLPSGAPDLHEFTTAGNIYALATFSHGGIQETVVFPVFEQTSPLSRANPTFRLEGIVADTPLLYDAADANLQIQSHTGTIPSLPLIQAKIDLLVDGKAFRSFDYSDCRVIDYAVKSQRDKEESYFKGFALSNTFEFECIGYHPANPLYDDLYQHDVSSTMSTIDYNKNGYRYIP